MNAKELIQAAKDATGFVNATREAELMTYEDAVLRIANHILATVREDDDEPITEEWMIQNVPQKSDTAFATTSLIRDSCNDGDMWLQDDDDKGMLILAWNGAPPTRGQLRKLLDALGVK